MELEIDTTLGKQIEKKIETKRQRISYQKGAPIPARSVLLRAFRRV
jgi:hypothetical protein